MTDNDSTDIINSQSADPNETRWQRQKWLSNVKYENVEFLLQGHIEQVDAFKMCSQILIRAKLNNAINSMINLQFTKHLNQESKMNIRYEH